jgi:hypothetical protein
LGNYDGGAFEGEPELAYFGKERLDGGFGSGLGPGLALDYGKE